MPFTPASCGGTLHHYAPKLVAFEHSRISPSSSSSSAGQPPAATSFLLWIGGLGDGLQTVSYPELLAQRLPPGWSLAQVLLSCSYSGWAHGSLEQDARDLEQAVSYFRVLGTAGAAANAAAAGAISSSERPATRIVLMGHSTGAQDAMEYVVGPLSQASPPDGTLQRPPVDGVILQAGISDREVLEDDLPKQTVDDALALAEQMHEQGRGRDVLPWHAGVGKPFGYSPTATRWLSLASPDPRYALDDYFSADLDDARVQRIWGAPSGIGARKVPVAVLLSGADEHMPKRIDKRALVERWRAAVEGAGGAWAAVSGLVARAGHNLNGSDEESREELCTRVCKFLAEGLEQSSSSSSSNMGIGRPS